MADRSATAFQTSNYQGQTMHRSSSQVVLVALAGVALALASACEPATPGTAAGGGNAGRGGSVDSGGSSSGGSAAAGSGGLGTGGLGTGGQTTGSGGQATGGGGSSGSGGTAGMGSGGTTGGTTGTGGATANGGTPASGGATGVGGTAATGGGTATGGRTTYGGAGGTSSSGGNAGSNDAGDTGQTDGARPDGSAGTDSRNGGASGGAIATGGAAGSGGAGGNPDSGVDPSKKIKVWLAGDSTMMNCTGTCPCGWGSQLQAMLSTNATVVNNAVGGRSIQTWLYDPNVTSTMDGNGECVVDPKTYSTRWQSMIDPTNGMKPGDYLFIEFGINDGDGTCPRHVGTTLFQSYLGAMAQAAIGLGAQPVLLTSTSAIACSGAAAQANRGFGTQTKAAGTANDVPVIDLTTLSAQYYTSIGLCPNSGDYTSTTSAVGRFFCEDHTHFEATGAAQIASVVAKALKDQGIGLAAYLK
jgi:lysophospholipase L1-like esterase